MKPTVRAVIARGEREHRAIHRTSVVNYEHVRSRDAAERCISALTEREPTGKRISTSCRQHVEEDVRRVGETRLTIFRSACSFEAILVDLQRGDLRF